MIRTVLPRLLLVFLTSIPLFANHTLQLADSLYQLHDYQEALDNYRRYIQEEPQYSGDFELNFKIGVCLLRNQDADGARAIFESFDPGQNDIPEYVDFFIFLTAIAKEDSESVYYLGERFRKNYKNHFLADSVNYYLGNYAFHHENYGGAFDYYGQLLRDKNYKLSRPYLMSQMAYCRFNQKQLADAYDRMYQVMKKYPSSKEALAIARLMDAAPDSDRDKMLFTAADVFIEHGNYNTVTARLEEYLKKAKPGDEIEKARYYLLRVYFERGQYQSALYGFRNLLENLQNELLESRIRLLIARSYLRMGQIENAAANYEEYSNRFPRKRMAAETMWKAAWLYEQTGDIPAALERYRQVAKRWRGSSFYKEATFRIGFSQYRLGLYDDAIDTFRSIINSRWAEVEKNRARFWLAKSFEKIGFQYNARGLYSELAEDPFRDYYSIRSFLHVQDQADSILRKSPSENPLQTNGASLVEMIPRFSRMFLVRDLLGEDTATLELQGSRHRPQGKDEWIAVAEIYKRLGAYRRAYQVYDYINYTWYADLKFHEKPFLLKEQFPLYYNDLAAEWAERNNVDPNLVMAIIREESNYDRFAHSWADAYGLMQIIPRTARALAKDAGVRYNRPQDLFDPEYNVRLGSLYVSQLLKRFNNRIDYVLASYNAGPHRVDNWRKITGSEDEDIFVENVEFSQTRHYVRRVLRNYWVYRILHEYY